MRCSKITPGLVAIIVLSVLAGFLGGTVRSGSGGNEILGLLGRSGDAATVDRQSASAPDTITTRAPGTPARILLVGDVLPLTDHDYFSRLGPLVTSADFAVCNLECPISSHGSRSPLKLTECGHVMDNEYFFRAPPSQAGCLAEAGFDAVTLANNHVMDFGGEALLETLSLLDDAGIRHTGAGADHAAARQPVLATVRGQTVAILAYVVAGTLPDTAHFAASDETAGTVFVGGDGAGKPDAQSVRIVRSDIRAARGQADLVIASFHWGTEGADEPDPLQRRLAHLAIDAGAEVVIGHHPHLLQGVEIYRGRPIAYSLGNFAFPTPWEANQSGAGLELRIEHGRWTRLTWHPVRLEHLVGDPAPARGADADQIVKRLVRLSDALGTSCRVVDGDPPQVEVIRGSAPDEAQSPDEEDAFSIAEHREIDGMAIVKFLAWDLEDGRKVARERTVVVHRALADEVLAIFREIYEDDERFPIHEVIGYDYRTIAGSQDRLSWHACGRAIDLNRAENPMIKDGEKLVHPNEPPYTPGEWRPGEDPYSIPPEGGVVRAFTRRGWRWGGTWTSCRDYQHFDKPQ